MNPPIRITTPRLTLREYQVTDYPGVHAYAKDPDTVRFMTWGPNQPAATRAFIERAIFEQTVEPRVNYYFVVVLNSSGFIIGGCGIHLTDRLQQSATLGYGFNKTHWGQGFATETVQALMNFGFTQLDLHRIVATCDTRNRASARVMEKNHMRKEAHFIKNLWQKGEWRDTDLYAILAEEWQAVKE